MHRQTTTYLWTKEKKMSCLFQLIFKLRINESTAFNILRHQNLTTIFKQVRNIINNLCINSSKYRS